MRQVTLRIVPFLMVCYFISFLDRVNLGFAALEMVKDLHLSPTVFGFGGGIFFLSYFLFEVPSNLLLEKFGARRWIARIMITWGVLAACMALVAGPRSLYLLRLLLGAAEAGFFPGVILYLTYWFPAEYRARIIGLFMVAIPVSSFIGSPISAALLGIDGWLGLRGWQWMFILEAIPAVALGLACLVPDEHVVGFQDVAVYAVQPPGHDVLSIDPAREQGHALVLHKLARHGVAGDGLQVVGDEQRREAAHAVVGGVGAVDRGRAIVFGKPHQAHVLDPAALLLGDREDDDLGRMDVARNRDAVV